MKIKDEFKFEDAVSGLNIYVKPGEKLDVLHIEPMEDAKADLGNWNRDLFFRKDGTFDGTGGIVNFEEK